MLYTLIALVLGFCTPIQTAANSRMRQLVSSAPLSTLISFAVSTIVLIIVALIASIPLMPSPQAFHDAPWWSWFIGVIPLITITIAIHLFKELGQLQAMVIPMFSQLIFSLCIDHFGWFGAKVMPLGWQRAIGALLLIVGVTLVVIIPRLKSNNKTDNGGLRKVLWQLAAVLSGCLSSVVGAILASLGQVIGSAIQATTTWCNNRLWQRLANTIDWCQRLYDGATHWPIPAQPLHGTEWLARSAKERHIMGPNRWHPNNVSRSIPNKVLVYLKASVFPTFFVILQDKTTYS